MDLPEDTTAALNGLRGRSTRARLHPIPATGGRLQFEAAPPEDFTRALDALRAPAGANDPCGKTGTGTSEAQRRRACPCFSALRKGAP